MLLHPLLWQDFVALKTLFIFTPSSPPLHELMLPPPMELVVWEPVSNVCPDISLALSLVQDESEGQTVGALHAVVTVAELALIK